MEENKRISITHRTKIPKLYIKEKIPLCRDNIMKQTISKKPDILIDSQIEQKESIIHNLFLTKFGPNFFKKDKIIDEFKIMFGKYLLNIAELNLDKNKKEGKKMNKKKKKKVNQKELSTRINMGNMTYLNLRENIVSNKSLMNDKLFYLSKNLSISNKEKDVISNFVAKNKKNYLIYNNKVLNSKKDKINKKEENKIDNENSNEIIDKNKAKKNSKSFGNSFSQNNIRISKNIINLKKYLINSKKKEEIDLETLSSNNPNHLNTEKKNNPILLYNSNINDKYETKIENNSNSLMSNSQTEFYAPQISNFVMPKYNKALLDSDKVKLKSLYLVKNINDSEMSNNVIYNQCKSLSTNETNKGNKLVKHNSLINLSTINNPKTFKNTIDNQTNLLKTFMKNCNKRLVKIIDCNILKKIKTNSIEEMKRKDNLQLIKALIDKKLSKKILKKFNKEEKTIKQILKMSQSDENSLTHNKKLEKKYFLKHYKNMEDNIALFFVGDLFKTKHIKFQLNEFKEQRKEIKEKKDKETLVKIKRRLSWNNFKIKKIKFILMSKNEKYKNE